MDLGDIDLSDFPAEFEKLYPGNASVAASADAAKRLGWKPEVGEQAYYLCFERAYLVTVTQVNASFDPTLYSVEGGMAGRFITWGTKWLWPKL